MGENRPDLTYSPEDSDFILIENYFTILRYEAEFQNYCNKVQKNLYKKDILVS